MAATRLLRSASGERSLHGVTQRLLRGAHQLTSFPKSFRSCQLTLEGRLYLSEAGGGGVVVSEGLGAGGASLARPKPRP